MRHMELQAVVLAAGRGSRMTDLTSSTPKALLPVANMPLIWYPVNMLHKAGFEEALVVTQKADVADIQKALVDICDVKMSLDFVTIPATDDWGTADSLRHIKDKIKNDVLVVSCDLISDIPLHRLVDLHRSRNASLTMLLAPLLDTADITVPGDKNKTKIERDLIGLDEQTGRVLFFSAEADFEECVPFRKSLFNRYPCMMLHSHLLDAHLYIIKKSVLNLLSEQRSMASVKGELIPQLVRRQFMASKAAPSTGAASSKQHNSSVNTAAGWHAAADVLSCEAEDELSGLVCQLSSCCTDDPGRGHAAPPGPASGRCHAYIHDGFCLRANSLVTYTEANRQVPKQLCSLSMGEIPIVHPTVSKAQRSTVGADSMVGECTTIGERSAIKHSVIGAHCAIADTVKISNSIIMDHVTIKQGCVLSGCVVCSHAELVEECELKDCLVALGQKTSKGKFTSELIVDLSHMMNI